MNITSETIAPLTLNLKLEITEDDYKNNLKKTLNDYQRKANIPGFRPGKVPLGMIQKMYGKALLSEELNKIVSEQLEKHITDNKLQVLGHPIPSQHNDVADLDTQVDFTFQFEVGLKPEFQLDLSTVKATAHQITVGDEMVQKSVDNILDRFKEGDTVPELNQDLFDKVYGKDAVKSEAELRERIRQDGEKMYQREADRKFAQDAKEAVVEATSIELPDDFLKRAWILSANQEGKETLTQEQADADYPKYQAAVKWQLIENKITTDNNIQITKNDVKDYYITNVISQYFPIPTDEEGKQRFSDFAERMMGNQQESHRFYEAVFQDKIMDVVRNTIQVTTQKIDFDDFVNILKKQYDKDNDVAEATPAQNPEIKKED
ncbi:hypothetical protein FACS1894201_03180 [Bacteroidia bacterium]|nr:hypothetical protein FACS1894201_03180 [Bacteroidia bacterium]